MILAIGLLEVEWRQPFEDLCGTSDVNIQDCRSVRFTL